MDTYLSFSKTTTRNKYPIIFFLFLGNYTTKGSLRHGPPEPASCCLRLFPYFGLCPEPENTTRRSRKTNYPWEKKAYEFLKSKGAELTDADLENSSLKHLKSLTIYGTKVTGDGLKFLKQLKELTLIGNELTDEGLQSIKTLDNLEVLRINGKKVTDKALKGFRELKRLEFLDLMDTQIQGSGLMELAHLPSLKTLNLLRTPVKTVKHLAPCPALENLELAGTQIDDQGLENIQALKNLKNLNLSRTQISNEGLKHLQKTNLERLNLVFYKPTDIITDKGLEYLQEIKTLKFLEINGLLQPSGFSAEGIWKLQKALPQLKVSTGLKK